MTVMIDSAGGQVRVDPLTGAISPVDTLARELSARGVDTFLEPLPNLNKAGRQWVSGDAPAVGFITTFAAYDAAVGSACHVQPVEYPKGGIVIVQAGFKPLDTMDEAIAAALRVLRGGLTALLSPVERWAGVNESVWDELLSAAGIRSRCTPLATCEACGEAAGCAWVNDSSAQHRPPLHCRLSAESDADWHHAVQCP